MAKQEGVRRIVIIGKLIVLIGITLSTLSVVMVFGFRDMFPYLIALAPIGLEVAAFGALVWAAGWIAQGFTRPDP